jgi:DNA-binding NtrC family response regulator
MRQVKETIAMAAEVDAPVLITGETGTGKELAARAIHDSRSRKNGVFVKVDCGTLSANLIESELFGHDRGAFTDAFRDKKGLVEVADDGTLFLDEIGNLPISLQPKLLRLIEESIFRKVGGIKDIRVRVRIIAATNADIGREIDAGNFREDLYYRLNVIPLELPPLRDRGRDVLLLADSFLRTLGAELKKEIKGITPSAIDAMLAHDWPGNIRELRNLIEREVIFCKGGWLAPTGLRPAPAAAPPHEDEFITLRENEKRYIRKVLKYTNNNKSKTARILEISRTTLREKLD